MQLEEGKRYVLRDGRITGPLKRRAGGGHSEFKCYKHDLSWHVSGSWISNAEREEDIIREYIEPAAPAPLNLEVGKAYKTKGGWRAVAVEDDGCNVMCCHDVKTFSRGWGKDCALWLHTRTDGRCGGDYNSPRHIIGLWTDKDELTAVVVQDAAAPASTDPAMAAFIEDRRAALRKTMNAPKPFELGQQPSKPKIPEPCPCCKNASRIFAVVNGAPCPECGGTGMQKV